MLFSTDDLLSSLKKKYRHIQSNRSLARQIARHRGINFHRKNPRNVGDLNCAPVQYLKNAPDFTSAEIFRCRSKMDLMHKHVIVGGGGLFSNSFFSDAIGNIIASSPKTLVCWGAGQNTHDCRTVSFPGTLRAFHLVGIRDYGSPYEWVPCASCLSPVFDKHYEKVHEIALFNHSEFPGLVDLPFPLMDNNETSFEKIIDFLGSANTVITTSYHGAYWATLLGCHVVVINPFSSKFFAFKHPPVLTSAGDWKTAIKQTTAFPEALDECRQRNIQFARKVSSYTGVELAFS